MPNVTSVTAQPIIKNNLNKVSIAIGLLIVGIAAVILYRLLQDIEPGKVVSGSPSMDNKLWLRSTALIKRLPELLKRIEALEKK